MKKVEQKAKHLKLLEVLYTGKKLSLKQIGARFKAKNPADLIYKIRALGVEVETTKNSKGNATYSLQ